VEGKLLWEPSAERVAAANLTAFRIEASAAPAAVLGGLATRLRALGVRPGDADAVADRTAMANPDALAAFAAHVP
jgi:hypothetical protein